MRRYCKKHKVRLRTAELLAKLCPKCNDEEKNQCKFWKGLDQQIIRGEVKSPLQAQFKAKQAQTLKKRDKGVI